MNDDDKILETKIALLQVGDYILRESWQSVNKTKILHISKNYIFTNPLHFADEDILSCIHKSSIGLTALRKNLYFNYSNTKLIHCKSREFYKLMKD